MAVLVLETPRRQGRVQPRLLLPDEGVGNVPEREPVQPPPDDQRCATCGGPIDLDRPLPSAGWHVMHRCLGESVIEGYASAAGERPWQWRMREDR